MSNDGQDLSPAGDYGLTTEAASAKLQELTTAYRGTPSADPPMDANAARARVQALTNDPKFYDRLMRGSVEARKEWDNLNQLIAAEDGNAGGLIETVDSISDPNAQSRAARAALFDGLQAQGFADSAVDYVEGLDRGEIDFRPTEGDALAAKEILDRLSKSSRWHERIFKEQDPVAIEAMTKLSAVVALAAQDGEPVTEATSKFIAKLLDQHK
jgi:hypothetical protein